MAKIVLPREHGSWAMLFIPVLLGTLLTHLTWQHLLFISGWFFFYLSSTPMLNMIRNQRQIKTMLPWFFGYGVPALLCLLPVIWHVPQIALFALAVLPLLCVNIYFIHRRNERALLNDLCGIAILSIGGPITYYLGTGMLSSEMFVLFILTILYFMGSAFYVKSLIRERNNPLFSKKSHIFHVFQLIASLLIDGAVILAFLPGALKNWLTPRSKKIKPIHTGIIEIVNSVIFFFLVLTIKGS